MGMSSPVNKKRSQTSWIFVAQQRDFRQDGKSEETSDERVETLPEEQKSRPSDSPTNLLLLDIFRPVFVVLQFSSMFHYKLVADSHPDTSNAVVPSSDTSTSVPAAPGARRWTFSYSRAVVGMAFGSFTCGIHITGLVYYLEALMTLRARLPESGILALWIAVLTPTFNASFSSLAFTLKMKSFKNLMSIEFPETDNLVQSGYDDGGPEEIPRKRYVRKCWIFVAQQLVSSCGILVGYGCLGKHATGTWLAVLHGILYSVSYFILFGIIDTFHHTFMYGVLLVAKDMRTDLERLSAEFDNERNWNAGGITGRLRKLRKRHLILSQMPERLSDCMSPILLLDCLAFGVTVTTQVFLAVLIFDTEALQGYVMHAAMLAFNSIICVGRLVHTCVLTSYVEDELKSLTPVLCKFDPGNGNSEISSEARAFIQQTTALEPRFSASGFFNLNKSTITAALSTVATYLIILGEFHVSEMELAQPSPPGANG